MSVEVHQERSTVSSIHRVYKAPEAGALDHLRSTSIGVLMANPSGNQVPRKSYLAKKTRQVKFIPPAEAMKLVSGTRVRFIQSVVQKPRMLKAASWKARGSSRARTAYSSSLVSRINANPLSVGVNQTGKAPQESIQKPKPPGICSEGLKKGFPKPSPKTDVDQKSGLGVGKKKDHEKAPVTHKRKLAHEKDPNPKNAKLGHAAGENHNP